MNRGVAKAKTWLRKLAASRSRADWLLVGGVGVVLFVLLAVVTHLTPYEAPAAPVTSAVFQADDQAVDTVSVYERVKLIEASRDGTATGELLDGEQKGRVITVTGLEARDQRQSHAGDIVIVKDETQSSAERGYTYIDKLRLPGAFILVMLFVGAVALVGGRRGLLSIAGLFLSILVIGWYIIPLIMHGFNAFLAALTGAYIIATGSVLVAHGRRRRTYISIACIYFVLTFTAVLAWIATWVASLSGVSDEMTYWLSLDMKNLDMQGIVAGGIIIATLGALDDVVTTQVATVEELYKTRPKQSGSRLFLAASSVGSEHISSLVNTLALAYAGASLPLIIATIHQANSLFLVANSEYIMIEVVRTLVASLGLVMAVPLSTAAATFIYKRFGTAKR